VTGLRRDPMAMLPFCGYNVADYWEHWFKMGDKLGANAPKIFYVNWFRKGADGKFLWPGYGDNSRVLKWMCERVEGKVEAVETPLGRMPKKEDLDVSGLSVAPDALDQLLTVDCEAFKSEFGDLDQYMGKFGDRLPERMRKQVEEYKKRFTSS